MNDLALFSGEDILTARCDDSDNLQAKAELFRQSGLWEEVVRGMTDLTVKYDPLLMSREEAAARFRQLWDAPIPATEHSGEPVSLDASFADADAPDRDMVARELRINTEDLVAWLLQRCYRVTMMGFQPGFAYLEDCAPSGLPTLARLSVPRQRVAAGSIGFLGARSCIYAHDGPGGWPIIGRVRSPLFRRSEQEPFVLRPGQLLRFIPT